jgi:5'-deoxynucleotidase YfbR-like HD superfamily hydrolase
MRDLATLYRSASVRRWHAYPELPIQTLADHQGRCAQILLALCPEASAALLDAVLHHDVSELFLGDLPWGAKRRNPALAVAYENAELARRHELVGLPALSPREAQWLHLVDRIEAHAWMATHAPREMDGPRKAEWLQGRSEILRAAAALGVAERVAEWFQAMEGRP